MKVAKIVVMGPSKSFKSTIAQIIKNALAEEGVGVEMKDDIENDHFLLKKWLLTKEKITLEILQTNRGD